MHCAGSAEAQTGHLAGPLALLHLRVAETAVATGLLGHLWQLMLAEFRARQTPWEVTSQLKRVPGTARQVSPGTSYGAGSQVVYAITFSDHCPRPLSTATVVFGACQTPWEVTSQLKRRAQVAWPRAKCSSTSIT